jgi:hypothetical protein
MSLSVLANAREMSDRQLKKSSYKSGYTLHSGAEPNIDKKAQLFRGSLAFYPTMEDVCCLGSGTKQVQPARPVVPAEGGVFRRPGNRQALNILTYAKAVIPLRETNALLGAIRGLRRKTRPWCKDRSLTSAHTRSTRGIRSSPSN